MKYNNINIMRNSIKSTEEIKFILDDEDSIAFEKICNLVLEFLKITLE